MNALLSVIVGLALSASAVAGLIGGILGDVDDSGHVDETDWMWMRIYSAGVDSSITVPGDISLGDVNADSRIDSTDIRLIMTYILNPADPALPPGIGQPSGSTCVVGLELSPGQSCIVDISNVNDSGKWKGYYRFKVKANGRGCYSRFEEHVLGSGQSTSTADINAPSDIDNGGFRASRIEGTSKWRIDALP